MAAARELGQPSWEYGGSDRALVTTGRQVPGRHIWAVTAAGTWAALAGAAFIGGVGFILIQGAALCDHRSSALSDWILCRSRRSAAGGSLFDSWLVLRECHLHLPTCGLTTERTVHGCGAQTQLLRVDAGSITIGQLRGLALGALLAAATFAVLRALSLEGRHCDRLRERYA